MLEYNELAIEGTEVPFIAYEKCIICDKKRKFVQGWIDVTDIIKKGEKDDRGTTS